MLETINHMIYRLKRAKPYIVTKDIYITVDALGPKNILFVQVQKENNLWHLHILHKLFGCLYLRTGRIRSYGVRPQMVKIK